jgi:hypothetical protein
VVRPLRDHLDAVGEAPGRGEDRAGVADGDAVAEEVPDAGHRRRVVDRAEDQHPRRRRERLQEHAHGVLAALPLGPVVPQAGGAESEFAAGVGGHGRVQAARAERAGGPVRPDHERRPASRRAVGDGRQGDRLARRDRVHEHAEAGIPLGRDRAHQQRDLAAAGQTDGEGVLVAVAEGLQPGLATRGRLLRQLEHRALDAAPGHTAHDLVARAHRHRRTRSAWRAAADLDDGRETERGPGRVPAAEHRENVTHEPLPSL